MKYYAIYTPTEGNSGEIKRAGLCQDDAIAKQATDGDHAIETSMSVTPALHKIVAGAVADKTPDEIAAWQAARAPKQN